MAANPEDILDGLLKAHEREHPNATDRRHLEAVAMTLLAELREADKAITEDPWVEDERWRTTCFFCASDKESPHADFCVVPAAMARNAERWGE